MNFFAKRLLVTLGIEAVLTGATSSNYKPSMTLTSH